MNIVIIDDDQFKREILKLHILEIDNTANMKCFSNYQDAIMYLNSNQLFVDYLFLDWCFPPNSYSKPKYGMGRQVLTNFKYHGIDIKTIICSADETFVNSDDYPFVVGHILLDSPDELTSKLNDIFNRNIVHEEVKIKEVKPDTGYKRRRSSTPWWMK